MNIIPVPVFKSVFRISLDTDHIRWYFYRFTLCFFLCLFSTAAYTADTKSKLEWIKVRGVAQDISVGANGETFVVGNDGVVWRWRREGSGWSRRSGIVQRIAVDPNGSHWGVAEDGRTYRMSGLWWRQIDDLAQDIAIGSDGTVIKSNQDDSLARWDKFSGRWKPISGTGKRIAVGPKGKPWVVKADKSLAYYDGREWQSLPGQAIDIAVAPTGAAFIINAEGMSRWDDKNNIWLAVPETEGGIAISVGLGDHPWYVSTAGDIYASSLFALEEEKEADESTVIITDVDADDDPSKSEENLAIRRSGSVADPAATTSNEPIVFEKVKGTGIDLAIGAEGSVFSLHSDSVLSRWSNQKSKFQSFPGALIRIAVGPDGFPLGINTAKDIFRHDGNDWEVLKGKAEDIAIGADGTVIISDDIQRLFRLNSATTKFERISGKGNKIAVAPNGSPWVIRKDGSIFRCDTDPCTRLRRSGRDIAIGPDGSVFMVSQDNKLYIFDSADDNWQRVLVSQSPIAVAVGPQGRPWFADTKNDVYASTFFERDESDDSAVARRTKKPTEVSSSIFITASTSTFTFTKNLKFEEIVISSVMTTDNIGIGIDGSVLVLVEFEQRILRYDEKAKDFEEILSLAEPVDAISSDAEGRVWIISAAQGALFQKKKDVDSFTTYSFSSTGSLDPDIAIGGDGSVFVTWRDGKLYKFNASKNKFEKFINSGSYKKVAVGIDGRPWVIEDDNSQVKEFDGTKFVKPGGKTKTANDIGIGAGGTVYIVDKGTDKLNKWNVTNQSFDKVDKTADHVSVDPDGRPWYLNTSSSLNAFRAK